MASPTQWTWVWVNSGSWWWTGKPSVLQSMGLQRVWHDWATELNWTFPKQNQSRIKICSSSVYKQWPNPLDYNALSGELSSLFWTVIRNIQTSVPTFIFFLVSFSIQYFLWHLAVENMSWNNCCKRVNWCILFWGVGVEQAFWQFLSKFQMHIPFT